MEAPKSLFICAKSALILSKPLDSAEQSLSSSGYEKPWKPYAWSAGHHHWSRETPGLL
jgi:hypothetical protein